MCGVRSYSKRLTEALEGEIGPTRTCWWEQPHPAKASGLRASWAVFADSVRRVRAEEAPDWVLLHYSVFVWGSHGVPYLVPALRSLLDDLGVPVAVILHEYALTPRWSAPKESLLALTQQAALTWLLPSCQAAIVTTDRRLAALRADRRARHLRLAFLPVLSAVAPVTDVVGDGYPDGSPAGTGGKRGASGGRARHPGHASADGTPAPSGGGSSTDAGVVVAGPSVRLGVLGFATPGYPAGVVAGAVGRLLAGGYNVELVLVGWPGDDSGPGRRWRSAAQEANCASVTSFTGVLDDEGLSRALASLEVFLFPDVGGPSGRRTTLAAALAHGLPVVAFDGPDRWDTLMACGAVTLAEPDARALAAACGPLVADPEVRARRSAQARAFHAATLAPAVLARQLLAMLGRGASTESRGGPAAVEIHET
jgi:Glycosyl transferases group 1